MTSPLVSLYRLLFRPYKMPGYLEDEAVMAFFDEGHKGYFVDGGANHGGYTLPFEKAGWDGVLIEPLPDLAENLRRTRKAAVAENTGAGEDPDRAITMALFCYPVLMAADILLFKAQRVPVGSDQKQHVEMTRDIAQRFNHHYGELFVLPEAELPEDGETLPGLDGRKMSKSYDNTIPLFAERESLRKLVMKIKTNSQPPEEPKDPEGCTLFQLYNAFAGPQQGEELRNLYAQGIAWGEVKERLFALLDAELEEPRRKYRALLADSAQLEEILQQGARRARALSAPFMRELRYAVGLRPLH